MTQQEFLNRCKELGIYKSSNIHHDFLPTCSNANDEIIETEKYFYKNVQMFGPKVLKIFKKSLRVTVSKLKPTKQDVYIDYIDNFITVKRFSEYYSISVKDAEKLINEQMNILNNKTK